MIIFKNLMTGIFLMFCGVNISYANSTYIYTIQKGDTLSSIASKVYNNANKWKVIYEHNFSRIGLEPDVLIVGTKLKISSDKSADDDSIIKSNDTSEFLIEAVNKNSLVLMSIVDKLNEGTAINGVSQSRLSNEKLEALLRREEEVNSDIREERNSWKKQAETLAKALANMENIVENEDKTSWLGSLVE
jgi:hypothetical protein